MRRSDQERAPERLLHRWLPGLAHRNDEIQQPFCEGIIPDVIMTLHDATISQRNHKRIMGEINQFPTLLAMKDINRPIEIPR